MVVFVTDSKLSGQATVNDCGDSTNGHKKRPTPQELNSQMKKSLATFAGAITLTLAAGASATDYVQNYADIVKAADWNAMTTLTVNMNEFEYEFDTDLEFNAGQTYKLEIKNSGEKKHYFTAPEFFKNIATRKAQVNGQAEIKAPYFDALEILPGGQLDLYFVAHNKGEYQVICTIDDHQAEGMEETIIIK